MRTEDRPEARALAQSPNRASTLILLSLAVIGPLVVSLLVVLAGAAFSLPRAKLLFLFAEHFVTLPILGYLGWKQRRIVPAGSSWEHETRSSRRLVLAAAVGYVLVLFPFAYTLRLGIYQADESAYLFQARCFADRR